MVSPRTRTGLLAALLALVMAALLVVAVDPIAPPAQATSTEVTDALQVVKENAAPSNSQLSVLLSQATPLPETRTVVIGRSDVFADSLASGVLQGTSPLLLVPPQGPIPPEVTTELQRLGAERVILLGGTTALGTVVEDELSANFVVERRAGQTRFETAIEIARQDAPGATTAVLARAFEAPGGDATQAFADTLAAGGMSAETGWPVLLTTTESLPPSTREYLTASGITTVNIVGGTSAISQQVQDDLESMGITTDRVQGDSRFGTAVAVAGKLQATSAADVDRITLVEGQGPDAWAGGFTAAAHSALFDAPILLTSGETLPAETGAFLAANDGGTTFAVPTEDLEDPVLTCVTPVEACESGRVALGLPPSAEVTFTPPSATTLTPGQEVTIAVAVPSGASFAQEAEFTVQGTCLDQPTTAPLAEGTTTVTVSSAPPVPCTIDVLVPLDNGSTQTSTGTFPGGQIVGTVRSATTDEPIAGATVTLSDGAVVQSGPSGEFAFPDLEGGTYTLSATATDFQDSAPQRAIVRPAEDTPITLLLSPQLQAGELRIVLSWDDNPGDLDSHLWTPESQPYHVYFSDRGGLDACPFANLDIDDTSGFGPETVTVSQAVPGVYRYAVHKYSGTETLSQSSAVVQVFDASGLAATFSVPQNGTDAEIWWHVLDVDATTGAITPVNRLLQDQGQVQPYTVPNAC